MTASQLVAALQGPFNSHLDSGVAAGALTQAQEADNLAGVQRKLEAMVAAQPGSARAGNKP